MEPRQTRNRKRRKKARRSAVMLCSSGLAFIVAAGMLFGGFGNSGNVQVASTGNPVVVPPAVEIKTEPEPTAENTNPYGVDPAKPMIALTFDDGPSKHTWTIVDTLKEHNARATFFVLGNRIATHQAAIDYVLANHNEIGSHSVAHKNLGKLSNDADILAQIRPVDEAMLTQHQYTVTLFRLPYGSKSDRAQCVLKAEGKPLISWSVDPYDWKVKNKQKIVDHVLTHVKDGDIILMHDIYGPTAEAVAELVPALQQQGYQLVTVSELLQFRGITAEPGTVYRSAPPQQAV